MQILKIILHKIRYASLVIVCCSMMHLSAQTPVSREYQLKAAFLFNFSQFIDWPPAAFSSGDGPLVIGVLGKNPFGSLLEETVSGEKINGHPVVVRYYSTIEEITTCHILFIDLSDPQKSDQVISALKGRSILTISDKRNFLAQGGMIKFFTSRNNIRFEVNVEETKAAHLILSSKLLRLAEIYDPSKNK